MAQNKINTDVAFKVMMTGIEKTQSQFKNLGKTQIINGRMSKKSNDIMISSFIKNARAQGALLQASNALKNKNKTLNSIMKKTGISSSDVEKGLGNLGFKFNKTGIAVDNMGKKFKSSRKSLRKLKNSTKRFNMNLLSIMFGMQMIKMAIQGFMKSALTAFEKANGEQNAFRKTTNKLRASWDFFKISIIDALSSSSMFQFFIDLIFIIINKMNEFLAIHPEAKEWVSFGLVFIGVTASILAVWASLSLLKSGIFRMLIDISAMKVAFKSLGVAIMEVSTPLWVIIGVILLVVLIFKSTRKTLGKILKSLFGIFRDIFGGIVALIKGDSELSALYFSRAFWGLINVVVLVFKTILQLMVEFGALAIKKIVQPFLIVANIIDRITGSNLSGRIQVILSGVDKLKTNALTGIDNLFKNNIAQQQIDKITNKIENIKSLKDKQNQQSGDLITNNNGDINISIDGSDKDKSEIADEVINRLENKYEQLTGSTIGN